MGSSLSLPLSPLWDLISIWGNPSTTPMTITTTTTMEEDDDARPWPDLPDYLMEMILERLPLRGFLVFAAVCRQWRSVQRAHRRRHSPRPPPTSRPHPCLLSSYVVGMSRYSRHYYSPFDPGFYPLQLSWSTPSIVAMLRCAGCHHGWLLLYATSGETSHQAFLFNPVSAACIQLPRPPDRAGSSFTSAMSGPPTEPRCAVLLLDENHAFIHLLNTTEWRHFPFPATQSFRSVVYVKGKFYCISFGFKLHAVDPFCAAPVMLPLQMECSQLTPDLLHCRLYSVESDGEVLVVVPLDSYRYDRLFIKRFEVFRADFLRRGWVRVESLGDRALFISRKGSFSLSAAEVGCRENCIYYPCSLGTLNARADLNEPWKVFEAFDLETGSGDTLGQPIPNYTIMRRVCDYQKGDLCWFLPKLDYRHST